jgi:hypothetical protein
MIMDQGEGTRHQQVSMGKANHAFATSFDQF